MSVTVTFLGGRQVFGGQMSGMKQMSHIRQLTFHYQSNLTTLQIITTVSSAIRSLSSLLQVGNGNVLIYPVCLSISNSKSYEWIFMKSAELVDHGSERSSQNKILEITS